jgi:hypothetical protein
VSTKDWQDPVTSRARQLQQAVMLTTGRGRRAAPWRAFCGSQYASMAPLFEHYGIGLWMPEVGGRVDWHAEDHEQTMLALGLSSKREITRTRIRVRTAMAAQAREQGRYPGGRPPYGYRRRRRATLEQGPRCLAGAVRENERRTDDLGFGTCGFPASCCRRHPGGRQVASARTTSGASSRRTPKLLDELNLVGEVGDLPRTTAPQPASRRSKAVV